MYPASTTKILTAILVLENCYLNEVITVSSTAVDSVPAGYVTAPLHAGEQFRVEQLLYALLIPSANDAANVLAEHVSGSISDFANLMNKRAKELGLTNSHFTNPSGIHNKDLYTTAHDLSILARHAMSIEKFREIVKTKSYTLNPTHLHVEDDRTFSSSNLLLDNTNTDYYYPYATGIKTGFTDPAGDCLVASAEKDGTELIAVCLHANTVDNGLRTKFIDCKTLFNFAFDNYIPQTENLQVQNPNKEESLPSLEEISSNIQNVLETPSNYNYIRLLSKIIAVLVLLLSIKFLFFGRKKKQYKRRNR